MRWFKATSWLIGVLAAPVAAHGQQAALAAPGPAQAVSTPETITLKVPVQLKDMVAPAARVDCKVYGNDPNTELGSGQWTNLNLNGQFDGIVEIVVNPPGGYFLQEVKTYRCSLLLSNQTTGLYFGPPHQGTPEPGALLTHLARPDRPFRAEVSGPLGGAAISGPGALQQ